MNATQDNFSGPAGAFAASNAGNAWYTKWKVAGAYALAVVFTAGIFWWRLALNDTLGGRPLLSAFLVPVIVASYVGGIGPGLLATALAALGTNYLLLPPLRSLVFTDAVDWGQWLIFILVGVLVSCVNEALLMARRKDRLVIADLCSTRERLREVIHEANELRAALDEHAIVAITDARGRITFVNEKFCAISKYPRAELLGQDHRIINSGHHPREFFRDLWSTIGRGQVWHGEIRNRAKDGTFYWVDTTIVPFRGADGRPHQYIAIRADVTQRKNAELALRASEQRFRSTLDNLLEGCQIVDRDWRYLYLNGAAEGHARRPVAELLGRTMMECYPGIERTEIFAALKECMDGRGAREIDNEFTYPDGRRAWFHLMIQPVPEGIFVLSEDVTAKREADLALVREQEEVRRLNAVLEQRVEERTAELAAANKELEAFSYSVSHDLRAPLRAVDGFSQALLEDYGSTLPEEGARYLQTIRRETQRMGMLIDDLLTFSRLSRAPLRSAAVDMSSLARGVVDEIAREHAKRDVKVTVGELPVCEGDPALLKQVWVNLVSNAFKYTGRREAAVIEIGGRVNEGHAEYYIRDNGAGFDMRYAEKLFGVFQRLHRADDYEGTGVGLAIVQRIVHRHGGHVWAEAAIDLGATFTFTIGKNSSTSP